MNIEQTIRDYIPQIVHLSLATVAGNKPWVCEVHYAYDDVLNLYFRSLPTRRHSQEIADNPNVSGAIIRQFTADEVPLGVYFEGTAERLSTGAGQDKAFEVLQARLGLDDAVLAEAARSDGHQFYKISVSTYYVFGKFGTASGQKYELAWNSTA